jgi:hypothetical protein
MLIVERLSVLTAGALSRGFIHQELEGSRRFFFSAFATEGLAENDLLLSLLPTFPDPTMVP